MRLYRVTYWTDGATKQHNAWAGTQADAKRTHKELCDKYERFNVDKPVTVEVPTAKAALINWLNENMA